MDNEGQVVLSVRPGSRVRFREAGKEPTTVSIRSERAWTYDSIEPGSPLARALMDHKVGDEVELRLAEGVPTRRLIIESIE